MSVFIFLIGLLCIIWIICYLYININNTINKFKTNTGYISFNLLHKKCHYITDKNIVKQILNDEYSEATFLNSIFNNAHGFKHTINNYNNTSDIHKQLHLILGKTIIQINKTIDINNILPPLFNKYFTYNNDIQNSIKNFTLEFWSYVMFGNNCMIEFELIHKSIIKNMNYTFYDNPYNKIPIIGNIYCYFRRLYKTNEFTIIIKDIKKLIKKQNSKNTNNNFIPFYKIFNDELNNNNILNKIENIYIENIFISFLVYDFVYIIIKGLIISLSKKNNYFINNLLKDIYNKNPLDNVFIKEIISNNYLFPIRCRKYNNKTIIIDNNNNIIRKGDLCFINLIKSDYLFSYGPNRCIGYPLVANIINSIINILSKYYIIDIDYNIITYNNNFDYKHITSSHNIKFIEINVLHKLIFIKNINNIPLIDINWLYFNNIFIQSFTNRISILCKELNIDCIASPEARGFILAGSVAYATKLPLKLLRNKNKLFNNNINTLSYSTEYSNESTNNSSDKSDNIEQNNKSLCIASDIKYIKKYSRVLLIDDGIASGNTINTCIELLKTVNDNVSAVFVMYKHSYCEFKIKYKNIKFYIGFDDF